MPVPLDNPAARAVEDLGTAMSAQRRRLAGEPMAAFTRLREQIEAPTRIAAALTGAVSPINAVTRLSQPQPAARPFEASPLSVRRPGVFSLSDNRADIVSLNPLARSRSDTVWNGLIRPRPGAGEAAIRTVRDGIFFPPPKRTAIDNWIGSQSSPGELVSRVTQAGTFRSAPTTCGRPQYLSALLASGDDTLSPAFRRATPLLNEMPRWSDRGVATFDLTAQRQWRETVQLGHQAMFNRLLIQATDGVTGSSRLPRLFDCMSTMTTPADAWIRSYGKPALKMRGPLSGVVAIDTENPRTWNELLEGAAAEARLVGADELVDVVNVAEQEAAKAIDQVDITKLMDLVRDLSAEVCHLSQKVNRLVIPNRHTAAKTFLVTMIGGLILLLIQYVLAAKFGIAIPVPDRPGR